MALYSLFPSLARPRQAVRRRRWGLLLRPLSRSACVMVVILTAAVMAVLFPLGTTKLLRYRNLIQKPIVLVRKEMAGCKNHTAALKKLPKFQARQVRAGGEESNCKPVPHPTPSLPHLVQGPAPLPPASHQLPLQLQMMTRNSSSSIVTGPYHNWELFSADYQEMLLNLKIFVYPDVYSSSSSKANKNSSSSSSQAPNYDSVFLPLANPTNPKLGNYYSEHAFKVALLHSSLLTDRPEEANFFFMPFSINAMRNHPLLHSASSISDFIAQYATRISSDFTFWNASAGVDHFYVCCHSIGRDAASKHPALHNNAIQVTCSSSYFQRLYITHKDIGLPQVWPRQHDDDCRPFNSPAARNILVFFAGRAQNSLVRQKLLDLWSNDTSLAISSGGPSLPYEEGFKRSKYCLHVKGYEVNTARVSDAIHYGCVPVIISNYYDLPFASVLDWSKFSIILNEKDIHVLKEILLSVSEKTYLKLHQNLSLVRRHFAWHTPPRSYDAFYMTAYQLWLKRGLQRIA